MYHVYLSGDVLMVTGSDGAAVAAADDSLPVPCVASDEAPMLVDPLQPTIVNAHNDVMAAMASYLMIASNSVVSS